MRSKRHIVLVERFPAYFLFDYAIIGNFALTTKDTRYVHSDYATEFNGEIDTPGHHFNEVFKDIQIPRRNPYSETPGFPYKCIPCQLPYAFYLDISQAYYQIASVYGVDCTHREGRYFGFGETLPHRILSENKMMRALLVSGTNRQSKLTEWKNHEINTRSFRNNNYAPGIREAILRTLHAIQALVSDWSVYCHTDGFIIPYWHLDRVIRILNERGIQYKIKAEGLTEIFNVGQYSIGATKSVNLNLRKYPANGIRFEARDWWLRQWDRGRSIFGRNT